MKRTGHQTPGTKKKEKKKMQGRVLLTAKELEGIKARLDAGDKHMAIAKDFDRASSLVYRVKKAIDGGTFLEWVARAQQHEVQIKKAPNASKWEQLSADQRSKQVTRLKEQGLSSAQVAAKFGVHPGKVAYHYYRKFGPNHHLQTNNEIKSATDKKQAKALELREQGLNVKQIAAKMGITTGAVGYYFYGRQHHQNGRGHFNGNGASRNGAGATITTAASAQENLLIGFAYAETERFIGLLSERLRLSPEILRPRLSKLLGHSPLRA